MKLGQLNGLNRPVPPGNGRTSRCLQRVGVGNEIPSGVVQRVGSGCRGRGWVGQLRNTGTPCTWNCRYRQRHLDRCDPPGRDRGEIEHQCIASPTATGHHTGGRPHRGNPGDGDRAAGISRARRQCDAVFQAVHRINRQRRGRGHRQLVECRRLTGAAGDIGHLGLSRQVGDVAGACRQPIASVAGEIPLGRVCAANRQAAILEPTDRRDFQPVGGAGGAGIGQAEREYDRGRSTCRHVGGTQANDIHHIAGVVTSGCDDRFRIAGGVPDHRIDRDHLTIGRRLQRDAADGERLAIFGGADQRGIFSDVGRCEDLDKRRRTRRTRGGVGQRHGFSKRSTGQSRSRTRERHRRNR